MIPPTAAEVREWSKLDFGTLDYGDDASLGVLVAQATAALILITGQNLASLDPALEPLAQQAIRGLTEQLAYQAQPDMIETLSDFDLIQSFNAGPYSETRRSAEDAIKARLLNAWPWLNALLWGLLTPDKYDYWTNFFGGTHAPAFAVSEMDWGAYQDFPPFGTAGPMWGSDA